MASSLRSFSAADADRVVELSRLALARPELHVGNPVWSTREELEAETAEWDPRPEETLLVGEDEGRVAGFGGVEFPRAFEHAELFGPLVAADARGRGLGGQLLDATIERATTGGAASVLASVGTRNAAGRILLERRGFRPHGTPQATFRLNPASHRPVDGVPADVAVRPASVEDVEPALGLYHECFPEGRFPDRAWEDNVAHGTVYAAEHDGRVVAILNIDPSDRWIYHVGVTESERSRGVGATLLSRSLQDYWSRHPGETLGLDVAADNVPAIKLYRRQGFAPWLVLQTYELTL